MELSTDPVKLLLDMSKMRMLDAFINEDGIFPSKKLLANASLWRLGRDIPRLDGTSPLK
jgi:hypothetical protein